MFFTNSTKMDGGRLFGCIKLPVLSFTRRYSIISGGVNSNFEIALYQVGIVLIGQF